MKKIVLLVLGVGLFVGCYAATLPTPRVTPLVPLDKVAVVVNNSVITQAQIDQAVQEAKQQLRQSQTPLPPSAELRKQVINSLVDNKLLTQLVKQYNITISDDDLNNAIANVAKQNHMSLAQLKAAIEQQGHSYAQYRRKFRQQMAVAQLQQAKVGMQVNVSDQEVADYLRSRSSGRSANSEYKVEDILLPVSGSPSPSEWHRVQQRAQAIMQQAKQGKNFRTLAAGHSGGAQALKGGDLGWRKLAELPTIFAAKLKTMRAGQVAGPLRAPNGYHLIKLIGVRGGKSKLTKAEVRNLIYRRKFEERLQIWLKQIREEAYVKYV